MRQWFNSNIRPEFAAACAPFVGKPILYVEVGVWTGDSAEWTLRNVLTHPEARGVGIDSYQADYKRKQPEIDQIAVAAIERLVKFPQWEWQIGKSQQILPTWNHGSIDLLYLDGSHSAHDVVADFCYSWPHLRVGSRVIFDDYAVGGRAESKSGLPNVPTACKAITQCFASLVQPNCKGSRQFVLDVVKHRVGELAWHK